MNSLASKPLLNLGCSFLFCQNKVIFQMSSIHEKRLLLLHLQNPQFYEVPDCLSDSMKLKGDWRQEIKNLQKLSIMWVNSCGVAADFREVVS